MGTPPTSDGPRHLKRPAKDPAGGPAIRLARPNVAVDTVLFAVESGRLRCYLVQLKRGPLEGKWAFPGGLVRFGELLDDAARRELLASTGVNEPYLEQLFSFGDPSRDPRAHVVSVAYMALIDDPRLAATQSSKYGGGGWFEVSSLPGLAYDHELVARYALGRLKAKLEYTNVACRLLPAVFSFTELEELYSLILDRQIDRRNFRRRILGMGLLERTSAQRRGSHRPAALYRFLTRDSQTVEML